MAILLFEEGGIRHVPYELADRTKYNLPHESRFRSTDLYQDSETGVFFWGNWGISNISPHKTDTYHEVTAGEENRLDLISYAEYSTPKLWWVIALANNITNPLNIKPGIRLRVPSLSRVFTEINP